MAGEKILIVDDDLDILRILKDNLELDGFRVIEASSGKKSLQEFEREAPALIVLDLSLPDVDGIQVCSCIRKKSDVPIVMLTARDRVPDKVLGLESGADDYMAKPFDYLELAARIRACLRRRRPLVVQENILHMGSIVLDPGTNTVKKSGENIPVTKREFDLLHFLVRNAGRPLTRTRIRHELWPDKRLYTDSRTIDVHIQHLRSKLEDNPTEPQYILTVPAVGYMAAAAQYVEDINRAK